MPPSCSGGGQADVRGASSVPGATGATHSPSAVLCMIPGLIVGGGDPQCWATTSPWLQNGTILEGGMSGKEVTQWCRGWHFRVTGSPSPGHQKVPEYHCHLMRCSGDQVYTVLSNSQEITLPQMNVLELLYSTEMLDHLTQVYTEHFISHYCWQTLKDHKWDKPNRVCFTNIYEAISSSKFQFSGVCVTLWRLHLP